MSGAGGGQEEEPRAMVGLGVPATAMQCHHGGRWCASHKKALHGSTVVLVSVSSESKAASPLTPQVMTEFHFIVLAGDRVRAVSPAAFFWLVSGPDMTHTCSAAADA
jgi:hypothetical protein